MAGLSYGPRGPLYDLFFEELELSMGQGDKKRYTDKQKRQASHIASGYEDRGVDKQSAEAKAWATVNKVSGGGKKSGSGRAPSGALGAHHRPGEKQ